MGALVATENGIPCPWGQELGTTVCTVFIQTEMQKAKLGVSRVGENDWLLSCLRFTRQLHSQEKIETTAMITSGRQT